MLASARLGGSEELFAGVGPLETDANRAAALHRLADQLMREAYERLRINF